MTQIVDTRGPAYGGWPLVRGLGRLAARLRARRELAAARRAADREILLSPSMSLRHAWRAEEIVTPSHRLDLAHALRQVVRKAESRYLPGSSPVNRSAVRALSGPLLELSERLADLDRPAAARGVLLTQHLLNDAGSPLYDPTSPGALPFYVDAARDALDPR